MPGIELLALMGAVLSTSIGTVWYLATLINGLKKDVESLAKRVNSHRKKTHRLTKRVEKIETTLLKRDIT